MFHEDNDVFILPKDLINVDDIVINIYCIGVYMGLTKNDHVKINLVHKLHNVTSNTSLHLNNIPSVLKQSAWVFGML